MLDFIYKQAKAYENKGKLIELNMIHAQALSLVVKIQNKAFTLERKDTNILNAFRVAAQCLDLTNNLAKKVKKQPSFFKNYFEQKVLCSDWYRELTIELALTKNK